MAVHKVTLEAQVLTIGTPDGREEFVVSITLVGFNSHKEARRFAEWVKESLELNKDGLAGIEGMVDVTDIQGNA